MNNVDFAEITRLVIYFPLYTRIYATQKTKTTLILMTLDLEKAYDTAWRNSVLKIIQDCGECLYSTTIS